MRRALGATLSLALVLAALALAPRTATAADTWPEDLYTATLFAAVHWDGESSDVGLGVRGAWTDLRTSVPWGAELELAWLPARSVVRVSPSLHLYPRSGLEGSACERSARIRQRGKDLGVGLAAAAQLGGVLELGRPRLDLGGWLGGTVSLTLLAAHARLLYFAGQGPELEAGAGLRIPSIVGDVDAPAVCE